MVSSMCGDALVRSTKTSVPCLQSSMVVVASWSGPAWLLLVLGSCGSLRETWIPTCAVTFWSRRWRPSSETVFQHNNHPAKMTTVLLLKVEVMEWPSMSPDLKPIEHMWGILKRKEEKHHVSNIQQLCDVIKEEWKRMPATTCAALVNYMPRALWTQFWHVHLGCTHFCC